jgi:hypothetical protein
MVFHGFGVVSLPSNLSAIRLPLVGFPSLPIQYIRSYPPYLETVSSIRHPRTLHVVVTRDALNIHTEELHNFYSSPDVVRMINSRMRWACSVMRIGEKRNAYKILVGRPEGKRQLGRPRRRWDDNIKMDHKEIELECVDLINRFQDRERWRDLVNTVMNLRFL